MNHAVELSVGGQVYRCLVANPKQYPEAAGLATSYTNPLGEEPGRAYVLMTREVLNKLVTDNNQNSAMTLSVKQTDPDKTLTVQGLYLSHAIGCGHGFDADPKRAYLLELFDKRKVMLEFSYIESQFNVRKPSPPVGGATFAAGDCYDWSLDSAALWSWQRFLSDSWSDMPTIAGAAPTIAGAPHGVPQGLRFFGMNTWQAINATLWRLKQALAYDHAAGTFSCVQLGTQAAFQTAKDLYRTHERSADPISAVPCYIPAILVVMFIRAESAFDCRWAESPAVSIASGTGVTGAIAGTKVTLWDDYAAVFDADDASVNDSELSDRYDEVKTNWLADAQTPRFRKIYTGICPEFKTGGLVKRITYRCLDGRTGWVTEVLSHPGLPKPFTGKHSDEVQWGAWESRAVPDFARKTWPRGGPSCPDDACEKTLGGVPLSAIDTTNYDETIEQVLGHTAVAADALPCLKWFDVEAC